MSVRNTPPSAEKLAVPRKPSFARREGRRSSGEIRDAILAFFAGRKNAEAQVKEICEAVTASLEGPVATSSIRSYLRINAGKHFHRTGTGRYRPMGNKK